MIIVFGSYSFDKPKVIVKDFNMQIFLLKISFACLQHKNANTMYLNVNKISKDMRKGGGNSYTYTKVSNLLCGFKGGATKKEIQHLRKLIQNEFSRVDNLLQKLENE